MRRRARAVRRPRRRRGGVVFLVDVDNTLLDNDRVEAELKRNLARDIGRAGQRRYWRIFERLRSELGYADYLGAVQRYRALHPRDQGSRAVSTYLIDYPFRRRLFPGALEVLRHLRRLGTVVILSDGDVVFQPHKIERSGIGRAVDDVLIYIHKDREWREVRRRHPAERYVMIDDKPRILASAKRFWKERVTTVFVRQGHYARDPEAARRYPPADVSIERTADLRRYGLKDLTGSPVAGSRNSGAASGR